MLIVYLSNLHLGSKLLEQVGLRYVLERLEQKSFSILAILATCTYTNKST